jgi:hypothetical protein
MATEKVHSIKHAPNDVVRYGDYVNMSYDGPEGAHRKWASKQGTKTNQGPEVQLSMMMHSLRKEGSHGALLCEAVQGLLFVFTYSVCILQMHLMQYVIFAARIEDGDPGYEHDTWTVPSQSSDEPTLLRAERWYYKNMDEKLDDPDGSGVQLSSFNTLHMIYT